MEFYLLGRMESRKASDKKSASADTPALAGGLDGLSFGHDL